MKSNFYLENRYVCFNFYKFSSKIRKKVVQAGIEPATLALLAQSSNQLSYWTFLEKEYLFKLEFQKKLLIDFFKIYKF